MSERWAAIDFETATREATSACALGLAIVEDGRVTTTASWLIRPPFNEYEPRNTAIHGLGPGDTADAPEFDEVWPDIREAIGPSGLLAHNAPFDMRVLRALLLTRELEAPDYEYACTVTMARRAMPHLQRHTLDLVCDHCGIALVHHEAASDARACAHVALACAEAAGAAGISDALARLALGTKRLGL